MKNYFDTKIFITAIIAMVLFKILDQLFLDSAVKKLVGTKENFENLENLENENQ